MRWTWCASTGRPTAVPTPRPTCGCGTCRWQAWSVTAARAGEDRYMYRWQGLDDVPDGWGPSVVTIGVFDGVHRGHQRIVGRATAAAAELRLPVVVVTFDPHP